MKIWKDRSGKWIDAKEFKQRFSSGVEGVTPIQQVKAQMLFTWITMVGILCGIIASLWHWSTLWWLVIILLAGLGNTIVSQIGIFQRFKALACVEAIMQGIDSPVKTGAVESSLDTKLLPPGNAHTQSKSESLKGGQDDTK